MAGDFDHDARPLKAAERAEFMKSVCTRVIGHDQKMAICERLIGWPGDQPSNRPQIHLSAVAYADFLGTAKPQAYVSYDAEFEPHATNFGGGILLERARTGWKVLAWYSGGQMDLCVALPFAKKQRMLCLTGYSGSGEIDSSVWLRTVPPPATPQKNSDVAVLKAQDDRESGFDEDMGNYQCTLPRKPGEAILLSIDNLRRSKAPGILAEADILYAKPRDVARACKKKHFADAATTKAVVRFRVEGDKVVPLTPEKFTNTDY